MCLVTIHKAASMIQLTCWEGGRHAVRAVTTLCLHCSAQVLQEPPGAGGRRRLRGGVCRPHGQAESDSRALGAREGGGGGGEGWGSDKICEIPRRISLLHSRVLAYEFG